ncbi:hypothetical protein GX411_02970 [Candidatus Fermentibacteria bacterium]|nr:hypothetical protein [Candidatus Fermentibacteria bacterium]
MTPSGFLGLAGRIAEWISFRRYCSRISTRPSPPVEKIDYLPERYLEQLAEHGHNQKTGLPASGAELDWHTDPVSGYRFPAIPYPLLRLRYGSGYDPKAVWQRSSFREAVSMAASCRDDDGLFGIWERDVRRWAVMNPPGMGINWLSPMECARRAFNVVLAVASWSDYVQGNPASVMFLGRFLAIHAEYVCRNPEIKGSGLTTNHTTANYCGLLALAIALPGHPDSPRWLRSAIEGIELCMEQQVMADGMTFEGSLPYHFQVLDMFAHAALMLKKTGLAMEESYLERLRMMFSVIFDVVDAGGNLPQLGDDDSGVWVTPRGPEMPSMMATLYESIFGEEPDRRPPFRSRPESGIVTLRLGDLEAVLAAQPVGQQGLGGHNHEDLLQLCCSYSGRQLIVDPGTGSYNRDLGMRNRLRSMHAHNGPVPDAGLHYFSFHPSGPFDLESWLPVQRHFTASEDPRGFTAGVSVKYNDFELGRSLRLVDGALEVTDRMESNDSAAAGFSVRLVIPSQWQLEQESPRELRLRWDQNRLVFSASVPVETGRTVRSPEYDSLEEAHLIILHSDDCKLLSFSIAPCRSNDCRS